MHIIGCKEDLCEVAFAIGSSVAVLSSLHSLSTDALTDSREHPLLPPERLGGAYWVQVVSCKGSLAPFVKDEVRDTK